MMTIPSIDMNLNGFQTIPSPLAGTEDRASLASPQTGSDGRIPVDAAQVPLAASVVSERLPSQFTPPAMDEEAVCRFREAMAAPFAENARLQGVLNHAVRQIVRQPVDPKFVEALATAANLAPSSSPKEVVIEQGRPVVQALPVPRVDEDVFSPRKVGTETAPVVIEQSESVVNQVVIERIEPVAPPTVYGQPSASPVVSAPRIDRVDRAQSVLPTTTETSDPSGVAQIGSAPRADRADRSQFVLPAVAETSAPSDAAPVVSVPRADRVDHAQSVLPATVEGSEQPRASQVVSAPRADRVDREQSVLPAAVETSDPSGAVPVVSEPRADRGYSLSETGVQRETTVRPDVTIPVAVDETEREEEVAQTVVLPSPVQPQDVAPGHRVGEETSPLTISPVAVERAQQMRGTELVAAIAGEVADAILVSPGLLRGQGEIRIQLKTDVLAGTEVRLDVTGRTLSVEFQPVVQDVAVLINQNLSQLKQQLVTRIHAFDISVSVRPDVSVGRLSRRRER